MTIRFSDFEKIVPPSADKPEAGLDVVSPFSGPESATGPATGGLYRRAGKRLLDILLVTLSAPFVLPLVAILALIVARDGGNPFYAQPRVGRGGRIFRMWKLRSMVVDADARMQAHLAADPDARTEWDLYQKLADDPRITPFGGFLRRASLDELPQLWNVLKGDMSLVGPRPMMPCQKPLYPGLAYYRIRPGITGYWQIAGRDRTTFATRARFDAAYEAELSLPTDAAVLTRTVGVVLRCTGR